ncbi:MAG: hypothetical protein AAGK02_07255 [Pseudomonadota bacterium]
MSYDNRAHEEAHGDYLSQEEKDRREDGLRWHRAQFYLRNPHLKMSKAEHDRRWKKHVRKYEADLIAATTIDIETNPVFRAKWLVNYREQITNRALKADDQALLQRIYKMGDDDLIQHRKENLTCHQ